MMVWGRCGRGGSGPLSGCWGRRGMRERRGVGGCAVMGAVGLLLVVVLLGGCSGSQPQQADRAVVSGGVSAPGPGETGASAVRDPRELSFVELVNSPAVLELGMSRLLGEVGALGLLEGYIIDVAPTAGFIWRFELAKSQLASYYMNAGAGAEGEALHAFQNRVLGSVDTAAKVLWENGGSQVLHDAFFGALEDCGRRSRWPDVELFVIGDGRGYDVDPVTVESYELLYGLSYYEYLQLRHECSRYAATYPGLDEGVRDELLRPQREHYARAVVDSLADLPHIEVPARYRHEWDELVAEGW